MSGKIKTFITAKKNLKYRNMLYISKNGKICKNMLNKTLYFRSIDYNANL